MSDAVSKLRDFLSISPSAVFPEDVFEYLPAIEAENAKLRALLIDAYAEFVLPYGDVDARHEYAYRMGELGVEADA